MGWLSLVHKKSIFISGFSISNAWRSAINLFIFRENSFMRTHKFYWNPLCLMAKAMAYRLSLIILHKNICITELAVISLIKKKSIRLIYVLYLCKWSTSAAWDWYRKQLQLFKRNPTATFLINFQFSTAVSSNCRCAINFPIVSNRIRLSIDQHSM